MKKNLLLIATATLALLSACSNQDIVNEGTTGEEVRFGLNNDPVSRTTVDKSTGATQFVVDDNIGIYANGNATASNVQYKVASIEGTKGTLTAVGTPIKWTTTGATTNFNAYYPYNADAAETVALTVGSKQTEATYSANDFMTSTASVVNGNDQVVTFGKFKHRMAMVQITWKSDKPATSVVIKGCKPTMTWTPATDVCEASGTSTDVTMWNVKDNVFWALVPAQSVGTASEPLFVITSDGKTYSFKATAAVELKEGVMKKYGIAPKNASYDIDTDIDADNWNEEDGGDLDADEDQVPAVELISAAQGDFTKVASLNTVTSKEKCAEGWNVLIADKTNTTITLDTANGCVNMVNGTASTGSWYNSTLYYCTAEGKATATKYRLTFEIKASAAGEIQLALMPCAATNKYFCQANTALSAISYLVVTTDYVKKSLTFDLAQTKASSSASAVAATPEDLAKVLVYFTPKVKGDTQYSIKNVTLVEVK